MADRAGYTILFVDDEQALLDNLRLQFGRRYGVHVAADVDGAKAMFERLENVDVVVSDLRMPGKSGVDLLMWVKGRYPDTMRILLTGYADVETAVRAVNSINVFRLLTKPCPLEVLDQALLEACFMREVTQAQQMVRDMKMVEISMGEVVYSLSYLVEQWDAYTAEHQKRVAELGVAIGRELGMDDDALRLLEMGALVHDLGKVFIPMAFLNKTGRLSDMEKAVIREHPINGYRMLCQMESMVDVAEIVAQHHERMNGSGYPLGLIGEDIRLEARIIAVADTVEAMISHRPYRPGLGLDAVLEELRTHRGTRYDYRAVDAACRILHERQSANAASVGTLEMAL